MASSSLRLTALGLLLVSVLCLFRHSSGQVLETPTLLVDPIELNAFSADGTCPAPPGAEEMYQLPGEANTRVCNATSNPPISVNTSTAGEFWKSGNDVDDSSITVEFVVPFVVNFVQVTFLSPMPSALVLSGEFQTGVFRPFMYIVSDVAQCQQLFGVDPASNLLPDFSNIADPFCQTFLDINPNSQQTFELRLFNERITLNGSARINPRQNPAVINFFSAGQIRLNFSSFADPVFPYVAVEQIQVGGHCICNGHATVCSLLPGTEGNIMCDCQPQRFTQGLRCEECQPLYNQQLFRTDAPCEQCQCYGHASSCVYDPNVVGQSININGVLSGGGFCQGCQGSTTGVNCEQCIPQFYHPGVPVNLTTDCVACNCNTAGQMFASGNCTDGTGVCINCKQFVTGDQCQLCTNNFFNLQASNADGCEPCNCFEPGTTTGQACDMTSGQCNCKANVNGRTCNMCNETFFGLDANNVDGCMPCECNPLGSSSDVCDMDTGDCVCTSTNITGRQCDRCIETSFNFPTCSDCECFLAGQVDRTNRCDNMTGVCINCKQNVDPSNKCEMCSDNFYDLLDSDPLGCKACDCNPQGTTSGTVCDKISGQCVCKANVIGRQCDMCADNFTMFDSDPITGCSPCNCDPQGSVSPVCNKNNGICSCFPNIFNDKCTACVPMFHSFPTCTPCDCVTAGQSGPLGVCVQETVGMSQAGDCAPCKTNIALDALRCERCNDVSFNLQAANQDGCELCNCFLAGTVERNASCAQMSGQCNCKPNVINQQCSQCADLFFNLQDSNTDGCEPCACNPDGSTSLVCNKTNGQCPCLEGRTGRQCDQCTVERFNFPTCELCNCNEFGRLDVSCTDPDGQCMCNTTTTGLKCDQCAMDQFGQVGVGAGCQPCNCVLDGTVSRNVSCDMQGTCVCLPGVAEPKCGMCQPTHFNFQSNMGCTPCNCFQPGQQNPFNGQCNPASGVCLMCKDNVQGDRCEECMDEFFNIQDSNDVGCSPCECNAFGTGGNNVCNKTTTLGECTCLANVIGVKCDTCRSGFFNIQSGDPGGCQNCSCFLPGSEDNACNNETGVCSCLPRFAGATCSQCAPGFFNFPNCEACDCSLPGTVNRNTTCEPVSGQCDCLSTHADRRCDSCAANHFGVPDSFNLATSCRPCECNQFGSINATCDTLTGQCVCVATTRGVTCDMCQPRHFNITFSDDGSDTFGGGCLRCDQCVDDLLDRVCIQESVVINATARINSTEVVGLIESANALPGLEDRYRILRGQTNTWRGAQIDQLQRLQILRNIELFILTNISTRVATLSDLSVLAQSVSGRAVVQRDRINAIAQNIEILSQNINDLSFLLINELNSLRQTRNSSQETVASAESVLAISFAAEMRMVTYAYDNATRVAAISATQLTRAQGNYNETRDLINRLNTALATIRADVIRARMIIDLADNIPPDNATEEYILEIERLSQEAVLGRSRYMGSIALTSGANTAAYNSLDAAQASLDMVMSALQRIVAYLPQLSDLRNNIVRDLTSNTPATTYYLVTIAEGLVASRRTYTYQIENLFNSTQPHAADAAEAIIDYRMADEDLANATTLVLAGESAFNAASTAAGNTAATQQQAHLALTASNTLLTSATDVSALTGQQVLQGGAILQDISQQIETAAQALAADSIACSNLGVQVGNNGAIISTLIGNFIPQAECAGNVTTEHQPRVEQAYQNLITAEATANAAVSGAAPIASELATLEARRIGMGNEVANVTDGVARLQVAAQQANQSLDDLLSRLERIRGRLTVAQTAYRAANFCCESLRLDVCPNNNNLVRLSTPSSFIRFDSGHSGAQPFDFNGDFIDLQFRTREADGVLLYFSNQMHSQFFGMELRNGNTIVVRGLRADGGTAMFNVPAANNGVFNDNMFHSLRLAILGPVYFLSIDNGPFLFDMFSSPGAFTIAGAPLYIGGTPPGVVAVGLLQPGEMTRPSLIGCFLGVIYNQVLLNVLEPSFIGGHVPCNCTLDAPVPTTPPPVTTPQPTTMAPTVGPTLAPCMNVTPAALGQGVRFNGAVASETFLQFERQPNSIAPLNFQEGALVTISFRTFARDGVLMYIANADNTHVVAVEVRNGYISTVIQGGGAASLRVSLTNVFVSDGNIHQIDLSAVPIGGNSGIIFLIVDDQNNPDNSFQVIDIIGDSFNFADSNLYIGGAPNTQALLMPGETTRPGFDGCVLQFVQQTVSLDLSTYSARRNVGPCYSQPINGLRIPGAGYAQFVSPDTITTNPLTISTTFSASARGTYLLHGGSAGTGTVTIYITPLGLVNARVTTANSASTTVSASPPAPLSNICSADLFQVTVTVGASFVSLNIGGNQETVPFDSAGNGFNPTGTLIIGQPPAAVIARDGLPATLAGFRGCVSGVTVNGDTLDLATSSRVNVGIGCGLP
ncbi:laminin-like protein epi-1 [Sycon ciliatum]|uniref:laminin-like protein epi-1 n=1 Tax=Sycon ciliatum TaxID=27933 RepID=UPI0031F6CB14